MSELDPAICCIKGCERPSVAMNLCGAHWRRNRLYGGPLATKSSRHLFKGKSSTERFEMQVIRRSGCWGWRGGVDQDGYPVFRGEVGGVQYARGHRYAYAAITGEHPGNRQVCHRCDQPTCTNPDHLFLGTIAENMADKMAKGRHKALRGAERPNAVLTEEQAIRALGDPRPYAEIASDLGVALSTIISLKNRKSWRHLEADVVKGGYRGVGRRGKSDHLTPEIVREFEQAPNLAWYWQNALASVHRP